MRSSAFRIPACLRHDAGRRSRPSSDHVPGSGSPDHLLDVRYADALDSRVGDPSEPAAASRVTHWNCARRRRSSRPAVFTGRRELSGSTAGGGRAATVGPAASAKRRWRRGSSGARPRAAPRAPGCAPTISSAATSACGSVRRDGRATCCRSYPSLGRAPPRGVLVFDNVKRRRLTSRGSPAGAVRALFLSWTRWRYRTALHNPPTVAPRADTRDTCWRATARKISGRRRRDRGPRRGDGRRSAAVKPAGRRLANTPGLPSPSWRAICAVRDEFPEARRSYRRSGAFRSEPPLNTYHCLEPWNDCQATPSALPSKGVERPTAWACAAMAGKTARRRAGQLGFLEARSTPDWQGHRYASAPSFPSFCERTPARRRAGWGEHCLRNALFDASADMVTEAYASSFAARRRAPHDGDRVSSGRRTVRRARALQVLRHRRSEQVRPLVMIQAVLLKRGPSR